MGFFGRGVTQAALYLIVIIKGDKFNVPYVKEYEVKVKHNPKQTLYVRVFTIMTQVEK